MEAIFRGENVFIIELTDDGKIKRGYANVINDYSAKSIKPLLILI